MNRYIFSHAWVFVITIALFTFCGCSDDDSNESQGPISSTGVCTKWGASKSEVMGYMESYEMNSMEDGFICYDGKNNTQTISYQFEDEKLVASLVLIPNENTSLDELKSSFSKYEYLGEKNNLEIFINETANTMVTIGEKVKNEKTLYAVGYVMLNDDVTE